MTGCDLVRMLAAAGPHRVARQRAHTGGTKVPG